jgi:hypothetical protein
MRGALTAIVFTASNVSLTLSGELDNASVSWLLTRESGRGPLVCAFLEEKCDRCAELDRYDATQLVKPYLVVKLSMKIGRRAWSGVVVAPLSRRSLDIAVGPVLEYCMEVIESFRDVPQKKRWRTGLGLKLRDSGGMLKLLHNGMFSAAEGCCCSTSLVCLVCARVAPKWRLFIGADSFSTVFRHGTGHWWSGVMDAGGVLRCGKPWLVCPSASS